jgi:hypothetical protein
MASDPMYLDEFSSYKPWLYSYTMVTPQFFHGYTGG